MGFPGQTPFRGDVQKTGLKVQWPDSILAESRRICAERLETERHQPVVRWLRSWAKRGHVQIFAKNYGTRTRGEAWNPRHPFFASLHRMQARAKGVRDGGLPWRGHRAPREPRSRMEGRHRARLNALGGNGLRSPPGRRHLATHEIAMRRGCRDEHSGRAVAPASGCFGPECHRRFQARNRLSVRLVPEYDVTFGHGSDMASFLCPTAPYRRGHEMEKVGRGLPCSLVAKSN
jgi:hypothetical protein